MLVFEKNLKEIFYHCFIIGNLEAYPSHGYLELYLYLEFIYIGI